MTMAPPILPPTIGAVARVRLRRWLIEDVVPPPAPGDATLVDLACLDDDAQGERLTLLWEHEPDAVVVAADGLTNPGAKGFDPPRMFAAYLNTLRWNTVTAADPTLMQAPFRAGIHLDAYQLEPLRKALALPRVNLFIADDVGLGKTIEAGLIARELLLRRRIDTIVVSAPPSMLIQWRDELEARFGLTFVILDREFVAETRKARGYAVNPWTTHSRFLISHRLLIDEAYTTGMRDWLGDFRPRSLLILDEAHHAAPASGSRYAIDSQLTRDLRGLANRFEHRLFLSATPHNGHSNSFSALLEILDPQRFVRGIKVRPGDLEAVMVRRLKEDIRELQGGFARRDVVQIDVDGLPADAPELVLSEKLDAYRALREDRLAGATPAAQRQARLVMTTLQQRLLSSIEAFARTIRVHRRAVERQAAAGAATPLRPAAIQRQLAAVGPDDERAELDEAELARLDEEAIAAASAATPPALGAELALLDEMAAMAEQHRDAPDARIDWLVRWIGEHMREPGSKDPKSSDPRGSEWNERRLLIFTEWEDTRRYVERRLRVALGAEPLDERIASFTGATPPDRRETLKRSFNGDPSAYPLRILICTDAAREGINLQRHCRDLVHFDLPWNPSRVEQRNGRIDRKLQPAESVTCRYFHFVQRPEDQVLRALVNKNETIRRELGSAGNVLEARAAALLTEGIRRAEAATRAEQIEGLEADPGGVIREELEAAREQRREKLREQVDDLRRMIDRGRRRIGLDADKLRDAVSTSLSMAGAREVQPVAEAHDGAPRLFAFPADDPALGPDAGWAPTLDLLRTPPEPGERPWEWRRRAPIRPIAFEDTGAVGDGAVHLHLEHRVVRRLLGRFTSQGVVHFDLSRACLAVGPAGDPRVVLLGRLSLFGAGATRLHDEIVPLTARWSEPGPRRRPLVPYAQHAEVDTLALLDQALADGRRTVPTQVQERLRASIDSDMADLMPLLRKRGDLLRQRAERDLARRGDAESGVLRGLLESQARSIEAAIARVETAVAQQAHAGRQIPLPGELGRQHEAEERQRQADRRAWARRREQIDRELASEPARIVESYRVRSARLEPIGLVYLWPVTG